MDFKYLSQSTHTHATSISLYKRQSITSSPPVHPRHYSPQSNHNPDFYHRRLALPICEFSIHGSMDHISSLASCTQHCVRKIHQSCSCGHSLLSFLCCILVYDLLIHFAVIDIFFSFCLLGIVLVWTFLRMPFGENMYSFLLGLHLGVALLLHVVCMCLALADTASFSKWFYHLHNQQQIRVQLLYIFASSTW